MSIKVELFLYDELDDKAKEEAVREYRLYLIKFDIENEEWNHSYTDKAIIKNIRDYGVYFDKFGAFPAGIYIPGPPVTRLANVAPA